MTIERQSELFKEFERKKSGIEKIADKITEKRKRLYINVPLENMIFAIIIAIMLIVTFFALGVESGKQRNRVQAEKNIIPIEKKVEIPKIELASIEVTEVIPPTPKIPEKEGPAALKLPKPIPREHRYTIQLISYKKEKRALEEKKKLAKRKINAYIAKVDGWYHVSSGDYENIKEANKALANFKKEYKSCFIKNK